MENKNEVNQEKNYPPVVSVLGHVDHGKTTLLDTIRKSSEAKREIGGITQKVGASQIEINHEGKTRKITFIDTPGHEAFANMRSQGVSAADIALLIVAADDGVKPQTKESIQKIKEANIPYVVVFTKIDLETANIERAKQDVMKEGILLEGLGGEVPYIGISAKTGEKVQDLLDLIVLIYDLSAIKKDENQEFLGVVIDSKLDKRRGNVADVVVKQGKISIGDKVFIEGKEVGKLRAIVDSNGKNISTALPGDAVEILGITQILLAGTLIFTKEVSLPQVINAPVAVAPIHDLARFFSEEKKDVVPIVLKTQTSAEIEAVKNSLPSDVEIVYEGQGEIGVSDVLLAKDFHALVIGFNVLISKEAKALAENEKVFHKIYTIIYELLDELSDLAKVLKLEGLENIIGRASIIEKFQGTQGEIIGVRVLEGRLALKDKIKIMRQEKELGRAEIVSIKKGKQDAKVADKNNECGIMISPFIDFIPGDVLLSYSAVKR